MTRYQLSLIALALFLAAPPLPAQDQPPGEVIDRVVAVVGDSIVLKSEINERVWRNIQMGQVDARDPAAVEELEQETLETLIDELILIQAAIRDSIIIPPDALEAEVQRHLAQQQQEFGGEQRLMEALRSEQMTLADYRDMLARQIERSFLIHGYIEQLQHQRPTPTVTEEEIRQFFEAHRDQIGQRPASISFEQVVVSPRPDEAAREEALDRAKEVLARARAGEDFAELARRYSQDPGSQERGGDLGWFRRGQWVAPFDSAVFAMTPNTISDIVETDFGFHIIKLQRTRGAERRASHILIRPEPGEADQARNRAIIEEVVERARAGEDMEALAREFGDPNWDARIESFPREQLGRLSDTHARELAVATPGQIIGPARMEGPGQTEYWLAIRVIDIVESRDYSFDEVRSEIREELAGRKLLEDALAELRAKTYIVVRDR